jgi:hypothetical protein
MTLPLYIPGERPCEFTATFTMLPDWKDGRMKFSPSDAATPETAIGLPL